MSRTLLLKNGTLYPMDREPLVGDILLKDGKIAAIGASLDCGDAEVIDVTGRHLTPGLVDAHSHIGLLQSGTRDRNHNENTHPIVPQMRAIDSLDPLDLAFEEARRGGVTACVTCPGSINIVGGTCVAVKTAGSTLKKMLIKDGVAMKAALGENPIFCQASSPLYPNSRMGVAAKLREVLVAAQNYGEQLARAEKNPSLFVPRDLAMEALQPVLRREMPLKIHCHWHNDILTAVRICEEFNLRYTLDHCTNGYLITDELRDALQNGCEGFILGPFGNYKGKHESGMSISYRNAKAFSDAGLPFCIMTDFYETQPDSLLTHAALAAAEGVPDDVAMKAVTLTAAGIVGLDDRIGSLTPGKDADVAVFSHYPLDSKAKCVLTVINGEIVYTR